jgi:hypothetical protein
MLTAQKLGSPVSGGDGGPGAVKLPLSGVALSMVAPGILTAPLTLAVVQGMCEAAPAGERGVEASAPDVATSRISPPHAPRSADTSAPRREDGGRRDRLNVIENLLYWTSCR